MCYVILLLADYYYIHSPTSGPNLHFVIDEGHPIHKWLIVRFREAVAADYLSDAPAIHAVSSWMNITGISCRVLHLSCVKTSGTDTG